MKKITNEQYEEYKALLKYKNFVSASDTDTIKKDIDEPVRDIVGMMALLGCEPIFSCCGFDYLGQPIHKTHRYGKVYFILNSNKASKKMIEGLRKNRTIPEEGQLSIGGWNTIMRKNDLIDRTYIQCDFTLGWTKQEPFHEWTLNQDCIHYSELAVIAIGLMEKSLLKMSDLFTDKVILEDGNAGQKKDWRHWQHPVLKPWTITKEDILNGFTKTTNRK